MFFTIGFVGRIVERTYAQRKNLARKTSGSTVFLQLGAFGKDIPGPTVF